MDIQAAVARLNRQLPLKARQAQLSPALKNLHQAILHGLIEYGRVPTGPELDTVIDKEARAAGLRRLGEADLIVLDRKGQWPVGAYPLTSEPTPHQLSVNGHTLYAMCALDALSVAPMFDETVSISSVCHVNHTPVRIQMQGDTLCDARPDDAIVGIRWQMPSAVAAHSMCMEMVFLENRATAKQWQDSDTDNISLFTLSEAVAFGKGFFLPLMA
ncbi:alkylmercury lyase family protein [Thiohalophilus thiocyanatoxydans]|uniref:Alkylmercury lyase-like protein n=1 Tax=Thiohalophilus thiocyanatoxydans TaxID=381308 RepID=A0A4R8IUY1_9GAMM|nr:alkylmercury lyase family protein [Thiohalophilus thiocyanatoxydans]TDY01123.1 alkylmercury lyase-like protein [Thiohalophilus thiocyanatoxydans]